MDARPALTRAGVDSHRSHQAQEYSDDAGIPNATATQGQEQVVVVCSSSMFQVPLEAEHRRWMQRHEATFPKLGFPNYEPVFSDVMKTKIQRLGNAQASDSQHGEQRRKGPWPD